MQNGGKSPQNRPSPAQNRSESKFFWIFPQPINRHKHAYVVLWAKYQLKFWEKVPAFLESHTGRAKNTKI